MEVSNFFLIIMLIAILVMCVVSIVAICSMVLIIREQQKLSIAMAGKTKEYGEIKALETKPKKQAKVDKKKEAEKKEEETKLMPENMVL